LICFSLTCTKKVNNCDLAGGSGAIIYNNVDGIPSWYLDEPISIPATGVSIASGALLLQSIGDSATLSVTIDQNQTYALYHDLSFSEFVPSFIFLVLMEPQWQRHM
jgi:hypothetical protein